MTDAAAQVSGDWRKLSAWSIVHFAARAVIQNVQTALAVAGGTFVGASQSNLGQFAWILPGAIVVLVLAGAVVTYAFYRFRVTEDSVQVRSGALFKRHLNLAFERIQNINLEHPFYFRPLGLVTLRMDSAGAAGEEVSLAALGRAEAEALRSYVVARKQRIEADEAGDETAAAGAESVEQERAFFTRSLPDLVVHGLTNNRAFLAVAGIVGVLSQTSASLEGVIETAITRASDVVGNMGLVRLAVLFVVAFIFVTGLLALLSVLVSIFTYFGFTIYRTDGRLTVKRGLFTRHEINIRKSRIQTVVYRQDWLDFLLGRRNVVLEQISHTHPSHDQTAGARKKILVPSLRIHETGALMHEVLPGIDVDALEFTPIRKRWFYKHAIIRSAVHVLALAAVPIVPDLPDFYAPLVVGLWPLHMLYTYMRWKRAGIAVDGELVVARSGAVGVDYHVFPAFKLQNVGHMQSVLMRRHDLSSLTFHTASSVVSVPYLTTGFAKRIVDYCLYRVEATSRSWM